IVSRAKGQMMAVFDLLAQPLGRLLMLALLHFVWQASAVVILLVFVTEMIVIRRSQTRYACSLIALIGLAICPLSTIAFCWSSSSILDRTELAGLSNDDGRSLAAFVSLGQTISLDDNRLAQIQPLILAGWLCGVLILGGRLVVGSVGVWRLRRNCMPLPPK